MDIKMTSLMKFLRTGDGVYHSKILELSEAVGEWLSYIPHTFPHYTRHTARHSEQIIAEISSLLFADEQRLEPSVRLSLVEAYILCVAAYLHDAGMVCADDEKRRILESQEWTAWTSGDEPGSKRWHQIVDLRSNPGEVSVDVANFLADVQARYLIAEFIRARHHLRGGDVVARYQPVFGRFAFDDRVLTQTIADVCVAHGLEKRELEDNERFPEQRDIRGEKVNVRFIAMLFRLGDLLDMVSDRACPILLNAACPLPAESLAHWTQYQRIDHRNISPEQIEIIANCQNQDEHRVLFDWCQWIVDEIKNGALIMSRAKRHSDWVPPKVTMSGPNPTIVIRPAPTATYIPSRWRLQLDQAVIIDRLIHDAYLDPTLFLRELVQNAADATRCRVYEQLASAGLPVPVWPTDISADDLARFPITIRVEERKLINAMSGESEDKQVVVVEDIGTGMNQGIVERYFLQIGRSYYTSPEFRRQFAFNPSSRFGIGFLSTFAVSDEITVDTLRLDQDRAGQPLRLTLTGPRTYLLTEQGSRTKQGTTIEVVLRQSIRIDHLLTQLRSWCKRVEFPIQVIAGDRREVILAERADQFIGESRDPTDENTVFRVASYPIRTSSMQGEIYVFVCETTKGERWDLYSWARFEFVQTHPEARIPQLPESSFCQHGISLVGRRDQLEGWDDAYRLRVDVRGRDIATDLGRTQHAHSARIALAQETEAEVIKLIDRHLATSTYARGPDAWRYKQRLIKSFFVGAYWDTVPETVLVSRHGTDMRTTIGEIAKLQTINTTLDLRMAPHTEERKSRDRYSAELATLLTGEAETTLIESTVIFQLAESARRTIFSRRSPTRVRFSLPTEALITWERTDDLVNRLGLGIHTDYRPIYALPFEGSKLFAFETHPAQENVYGVTLLNRNHPFTEWLCAMHTECRASSSIITTDQMSKLLYLLQTPTSHQGHELDKVTRYLRAWRETDALPSHLRPPDLTRADFRPSGTLRSN